MTARRHCPVPKDHAERGGLAPQQKNRRLRFALVGAGLLVIAALALFIPNVVIALSARPHWVEEPREAPLAPVAIVLGARVYSGGQPSPILADRLDTAIELYKLGKVKKLLLSGDHGQSSYDEVNGMLEYVRHKGVPDQDTFTDHAGFNTYETMYRARDVFQAKSALVVTQNFHLSRAVYTARSLGIDAVGVAADLRPYVGETRLVMRDWLARVKAFVELHLTRPEPRYLGPVIPIDGDGCASRD